MAQLRLNNLSTFLNLAANIYIVVLLIFSGSDGTCSPASLQTVLMRVSQQTLLSELKGEGDLGGQVKKTTLCSVPDISESD